MTFVFDWRSLSWEDPETYSGGPPDVEGLELAAHSDRENLTLGGSAGLQLICSTDKVCPERIGGKLQPELVRCPRCGVEGMVDVVYEQALIHAAAQASSDHRFADRRGIGIHDTASDAEHYLAGEGPPPPSPRFIFGPHLEASEDGL